MPVTFPTSLDTSTFPIQATLTAETLATAPHSKLHDELGQAILHLETKVGIDSSSDTSSLDYKINHIVAVPVGVIFPFSGASPPTSYLVCNGSLISTTTYAALFAVIGNTYGPGGSGTFALPDLRGRVIAGLDNMGGSAASRVAAATSLGQAAGFESHSIASGEMPQHAHGINHTHSGTDAVGDHAHTINRQAFLVTGGGIGEFAFPTTTTTDSSGATNNAGGHAHTMPAFTGTSGNAGTGTAMSLVQPYMALNYIIRY